MTYSMNRTLERFVTSIFLEARNKLPSLTQAGMPFGKERTTPPVLHERFVALM